MPRLVLLLAILMLIACSPTSITISFGTPPTATPTETPTALPTVVPTSTPNFIATAQIQANATAQAQAAAYAQATAAAQASATAQAGASTTAAAVAQASATAQAGASATAAAAAQANATATANAAAAATKTALLAYVDALVAKAGKPLREPQGDLNTSKSYWVEGSWKNFVLDVELSNPGDPAVHNWDYGLRFRYSRSASRYFGLYLRSSGNWLLQNFQSAGADRNMMNQIGTGKIASMNLTPTGSNKVRFVSYENSGFLFINGEFVTMMDLSAVPSDGDLYVAAGMLIGDDFPGMTVTFKNLSVAGLP